MEDQRKAPASFLYRPPNRAAEKTIVILGSGRGGTTAIATMLACMGLPFAASAANMEFDDAYFGRNNGDVHFFERPAQGVERYFEELRREIKRRDGLAPVWVVKDPLMPLYFGRIAKDFRNPHLVVVTRDPVAAVQRAILSTPGLHNGHFGQFYEHTLRMYGDILRQVETHPFPAIFFSYERLLGDTAGAARDMASFLGIDLSHDHTRAILGAVRADRGYGTLTFPHEALGGDDGLMRYRIPGAQESGPPGEGLDGMQLASQAISAANNGDFERAGYYGALLKRHLSRTAGVIEDDLLPVRLSAGAREWEIHYLELAFAQYFVAAKEQMHFGKFRQALWSLHIACGIARHVVRQRGYRGGVCWGGLLSTHLFRGDMAEELGELEIAFESYSYALLFAEDFPEMTATTRKHLDEIGRRLREATLPPAEA